jgi:rubrerythrin
MYYTGQEIMGIAVRIEENGNAFYVAAADRVKESTDTRNLFLDLAEKEIMHIAIFQKLAEKFEAEEFDFDPNEVNDYVTNLADQHIFGKPEAGIKLASTIKTPKEALDIAFKFENDSVAFYVELEKRAKTDAKKLIRQIIEEEKEHAAEIKQFIL